jgi:hypothetical protein
MRNLRTYLLALCAAPTIALAVPDGGSAESARATVRVDGGMVRAIRHYRVTTLQLQYVMGRRVVRLSPVRHASLRRARRIWRRRAVAVTRRYVAGPTHRRAWLCIHRYEGSWNDGGSPYYGGLQMDIGFQERYGRRLLRAKGTADHWTPLEQMWIAEKAYRTGRGFYPWPNTARYCGLL